MGEDRDWFITGFITGAGQCSPPVRFIAGAEPYPSGQDDLWLGSVV